LLSTPLGQTEFLHGKKRARDSEPAPSWQRPPSYGESARFDATERKARRVLGVEPNALCFAVFFGNVLFMYWAATFWGRIRGNRYLTFGIRLKGHPA
jgi:hypothetical protein